ncbi:MAG: protein tyrosine phosphatase family protein [Planctomycetes bacterium]|nr:protein tyrosine phosphatase family protein [Planctomycetota bacterium]
MRFTMISFTLVLLTTSCAHVETNGAAVEGALLDSPMVDNVYLAGQPTASELRKAAAGGIRTIINLRLASELEFDEAAEADALGVRYHNPGFKGGENLTDSIFDEVRSLLRSSQRPILFHCSSGNRVGAVWATYRVLDEGWDIDRAIDEAKQIGLRTPAYEARAREYVAQHQH